MKLVKNSTAILQPLGLLSIAALLIWYLLQAANYAVFRYFNADEFRYAHAAWLVARGSVPYLDFWDVKFPFLYQCLSLVFTLADDHPNTVLLLRIPMFLLLGITCCAVYRINLPSLGRWALLTPLLLLSIWCYGYMAIEIQPDSLATPLYFVVIALLVSYSPQKKWYAPVAGFLFVCCVWTSQKIFCTGLVFPAALIIDLIRWRSSYPKRLLGNPPLFCAGAGVGIVCILIYLISTNSLVPWYQYCIQGFLLSDKSILPYRSKSITYIHLLRDAKYLLPLAAVGVGFTIHRLKALHTPASANSDLIVLLSLPCCFLVWYLQPGPYLYSMLPLMVSVPIFATRGFVGFCRLIHQAQTGTKRLTFGVIGGLVVLIGLHFHHSIPKAPFHLKTNANQIRTLNRIHRLTAATDPIYDNSGSYVARPHGYRIYFTSALMRTTTMKSQLIEEVPAAIRSSGCTVFLIDVRAQSLPIELMAWLSRHFLPYDRDIWLWGQKFIPDSTQAWSSEFEAVRRARYFVTPPEIVTQGGFAIDGQTVRQATFELSKGMHRITYTGKQQAFRICWLPRTGEMFSNSLPHNFFSTGFSIILY